MPISTIKLGELFQLGPHRVLCADARDPEAVARLAGKGTIDLILADPPYSVDYAGSKSGFTNLKVKKDIINDHLMSDADYAAFTTAWLGAIAPHLARKNAAYIFNGDKMLFALREGMLATGINFSQLLVWVKSHSVIGRRDYLPMHELIAYGWKGAHDFHKAKDKSVLFYPKPAKSSLHPTMKPVPLLRHLILNSTKIGDTVYDCFLGSGSTLIACEQTRRTCLGIELDPAYCRIIIGRYEKLTGKKAIKLGKE